MKAAAALILLAAGAGAAVALPPSLAPVALLPGLLLALITIGK